MAKPKTLRQALNQIQVQENVVSCCKFCNQAKMDRTKDEFLEWLRRAYEHNYGKHN